MEAGERQISRAFAAARYRKEIQVDWRADGSAWLAATAGREDVTFVYPRDANHVLKHEKKPREQLVPAEVAAGYNADSSGPDEVALAVTCHWLVTQSHR